MKLKLLTLMSFFLSLVSYSQVGIGTTNPDSSSALDVSSNSKGILIPRMTLAERDAITTPAEGLLVFVTDLDMFYFYDSTASSWVTFSSNSYTGWADYSDDLYTSASPFILTANNKVTLPNNANTTVDSQKPIDITTFYDATTSTITGRNGDGININIEFKARPNTATATKLTVSIDIGGAVGEIYTRDFILSKGNDVEHYYLSSFNAYTLNTWEANGGTVKIVSDASADIYDIRYVITRTHKAR